jgi:hypothetical protein
MLGLKPTVFCGPMKSGTTWVHEYLKARGDVCLPAVTKEIFFFDRYYGRGTDWYERQFRPAAHHRIIVDVAPSIISHPDAPARVAETLPDADVVMLRRDPVARAWSHYLHLRRYGYTAAPLDEAIDAHPVIIEASRVDLWLERWRAEIGAERVHVMDTDLLFTDSTAFSKKLNALLGLPESAVNVSEIGRVNPAALPRHHLLSAAARRVSHALRDARMEALIQAARNLGLNRIYSSRSKSSKIPKASDAERDLIANKLMGEPKPICL